MKRTLVFTVPSGEVTCVLSNGRRIVLPVVPGILKHPAANRLPDLLGRPDAALKYTREALRAASWPVLRQFPRDWLRECLPGARLTPSRRRALLFLLEPAE